MNLQTEFLGKHLQSPLILASGPLSHNGSSIVRAYQTGFGAVVTKTISAKPALNPYPHLVKAGHSVFNCEKWSELTYQQWIEKEIPFIKSNNIVVIASIGLDVEDVQLIAKGVTAAGADYIELVSYRRDNIVDMVKSAVKLTNIPVIAKMSFNWPDYDQLAIKCIQAGASGISAIDSIGPGLRIDIETGQPMLGSARGRGWVSGEALKAIALNCVATIAEYDRNIPIIGIGGIQNAHDMVEMLMAGATVVGVCSLPIKNGLNTVPQLLTEFVRLNERLGYSTASEIRGKYLDQLNSDDQFIKGCVEIDAGKCTVCGRCVDICPYQAIQKYDENILIYNDRCHLCGYCISRCPRNAMRFIEKDQAD